MKKYDGSVIEEKCKISGLQRIEEGVTSGANFPILLIDVRLNQLKKERKKKGKRRKKSSPVIGRTLKSDFNRAKVDGIKIAPDVLTSLIILFPILVPKKITDIYGPIFAIFSSGAFIVPLPFFKTLF